MYKLYLDKPETFSADISVKNANLKNSMARLIVESNDGLSLIFKGEIKDGKCNIPIRKLKGLLDENSTGKMNLEVIVEDAYFSPWSDTFKVEEHTSVKVLVKEQIEDKSNKPIIEVKEVKNEIPLNPATKELIDLCEKFNITGKNLKTTRRTTFKELIREYFKVNDEYYNDKDKVLKELILVI